MHKSPQRHVFKPYFDEFISLQVARRLQSILYTDNFSIGSAFGLTLDETREIYKDKDVPIHEKNILIFEKGFKKQQGRDFFLFLSGALMQIVSFYTSIEEQIASVKETELRNRIEEHKLYLIDKQRDVESKYGSSQRP